MRPLGDEFILVGEGLEQVNFNKMITMNESAAYLWQKVDGVDEFTLEDMVDFLTAEYEVSAEQAMQDCKETAESWLNAGLIIN